MKYIICNFTEENDVNRGMEFLKTMNELNHVVIDSCTEAFQVAYGLMDRISVSLPSVSMRVESVSGSVIRIFSGDTCVAMFTLEKLYRLSIEDEGNFNYLLADEADGRRPDDSDRCLGELRSGEGELLLSELDEVKSFLISVSQRLEEDADRMLHLIGTVDGAVRVLTRLIEPSTQR